MELIVKKVIFLLIYSPLIQPQWVYPEVTIQLLRAYMMEHLMVSPLVPMVTDLAAKMHKQMMAISFLITNRLMLKIPQL